MRIILTIIFLFLINIASAQEYAYILNNEFENLYSQALLYFKTDKINVYKDIRGIVLTFDLEDISSNFFELNQLTKGKLIIIENFLAKIKNPVIIEVHTGKNSKINLRNLKEWEVTTVIANNIEDFWLSRGKILNSQIRSVGYGIFLPSKNTPNNGVKNSGRVDIIILCSINGE